MIRQCLSNKNENANLKKIRSKQSLSKTTDTMAQRLSLTFLHNANNSQHHFFLRQMTAVF